MDIVFLLSHIPNPRMNKRIEIAKALGQTALVCWDKQASHIWNIQHKDIKSIIIKIAASGTEPLRRVTKTMRFTVRALSQLGKLKPACIYAGNMDMLCIAYLYSLGRATSIIYEVADLNKIIIDEHKGLIIKIVRRILIVLEKIACKKINNLVLTSDKYYDCYYSKFVPKEKIIVFPNIPDIKAFENYKAKENGPFTIGFIGGIRYIKQMKMMVDAAEILGLEVLIAGVGFSKDDEAQIREYCMLKNFVKFTGRYDFMTEAAELYRKCDCIYCVYDADLNNVKVALPNKLYEAIYCELPIIVAKDTYLAEIVEKMGVGVAVGHNNKKEIECTLYRLSKDKDYYNSFVESCKKHKAEISIEDYNMRLKSAIQKSIKKNNM